MFTTTTNNTGRFQGFCLNQITAIVAVANLVRFFVMPIMRIYSGRTSKAGLCFRRLQLVPALAQLERRGPWQDQSPNAARLPASLR